METRFVSRVSKTAAPSSRPGTAAGPPGLRERILTRAGALFLRAGFLRVTADDIAAALGISKATLYRHFRSKEEILEEFVLGMTAEVLTAVDALFRDPSRSVPERLASVFRILSERFSMLGPVLIRDLQRGAPRVWTLIEGRREKILARLSSMFEQGIREGVFREDVDIALMTGMYTTLIREYLNPEAFLRWNRSPAEVFRTILVVFFQGILTERGRRDFPEFPASAEGKDSRP